MKPPIGRVDDIHKPSSVKIKNYFSIKGVHSSRRMVTHTLEQPTQIHRTGCPYQIWPCSDWGLPSQHCLQCCWCALTAPFHLLPNIYSLVSDWQTKTQCVAVYSLLHFPPDFSDWALPSSLPYGARTFLP